MSVACGVAKKKLSYQKDPDHQVGGSSQRRRRIKNGKGMGGKPWMLEKTKRSAQEKKENRSQAPENWGPETKGRKPSGGEGKNCTFV